MNPKISVVVPAYNIEKYIGRCLESILNQTYDNIEIIVVNDGSTDKTRDILNHYAAYCQNINVIHIPNGGVTNARLIGIKEATGQWIGFVDGDDEIESDMYERLMHNAVKYNADISHCGYKTIVNGIAKHYFYNTGRVVEQDNLGGLKDLIEGNFVEPGLCNKLYKKSLFIQIIEKDLIDKELKITEDLMMNYYLFNESKKSVYEDFCPYLYMVRNSSATRNGFNIYKIIDPIKVRKRIMDSVPKELKIIAKNRYLVTCVSSYTAICSVKNEKSVRKQIKNILKSECKYWKLLDRNTKIKLYSCYYMPNIYAVIYRVYEKLFQRKIYE